MRYAHPIARAWERYHVTLTPDDLDRFKYLVRAHRPEAVPLECRPDGTILVAIEHRPEGGYPGWLATVWKGGDIVTVLPRSALHGHARRLHGRRRASRAMGGMEVVTA